jgi:hypothetical protein
MLLAIIATTMSFSTLNQDDTTTCFPQKIAAVYYQKWVGGIKGAGGGTHFHIKFKKPLLATIQLGKIYFQQQEATVQKESEGVYVAHFRKDPNPNDFILNANPTTEYGNEPPIITKPKFDLKPNEAILEYTENNKKRFFKIKKIKEIPMIAYP